ncbi:MAG: hypothetical protein GY851_21780 [bacterium]|nr:hypothetical protein [bacterium]
MSGQLANTGDCVRVWWWDTQGQNNTEEKDAGLAVSWSEGRLVEHRTRGPFKRRYVKLVHGGYPDAKDFYGDYTTIPSGCIERIEVISRAKQENE